MNQKWNKKGGKRVMKYLLLMAVLISSCVNTAPRGQSSSPKTTITNPTGLAEFEEDLSDKELIKAILPHLGLVLKSFFFIVKEHQNFSAVMSNISQMVMSFLTIGGYMLRTPTISDPELIHTIHRNPRNALMLRKLAKQYSRTIMLAQTNHADQINL
jgi:hypothetical protein